MTDDELRITKTTTGFAVAMLGLSPYKWQAKALMPLEKATGPKGKRQNIAIVGPNGIGKDNIIIPAAAYWWLFMHPKGRVVIMSKSDMQLSSQTIPNLRMHYRKFGWKEPIDSPRFTLVTPTGGSLIAYVTNDGSRAEGHHSMPDSPLLMIVNEAKSVDDGIFEGVFRCSPDALMLISSPGGKSGVFYECFASNCHLWHTFKVGLTDCPHITADKIEIVKAQFGADSPKTRSTLYGEFMEAEDGVFLVCTDAEYQSCLDFPPEHKPGFKYGFFDFADGRAENTFVIRDGNKYTLADAWREQNEDAVVGRCIHLMTKHNLKPNQVSGDAAAKSILDKMASAGFAIARQNFGAVDKSGVHKSWSAAAWLDGAHKIKNREVILPEDKVTMGQVISRRKVFEPTGKLGLEPKHKMLEERKLESPDRADALFGAMAQLDISMMTPKNIFNFSDYFENESRPTHERELVGALGM